MRSHESAIRDRLLEKGDELFTAPSAPIAFSGNAEADKLTNDIQGTPHAFVLACVMDRQIKAELAWRIPYEMQQRLGTFAFDALSNLSLKDIENLMKNPSPLHRFPQKMSRNFHDAVQRISRKYDADASRIWARTPSSATVVYRFLEFRGVGPKIATMATNMLARNFKVPFSDYYSIDVSVDVQVRRVFCRLGLISTTATNEQVIYKARSMNPEFPGMLDLPAWEVGRRWCRPKAPICDECYLNAVCPSAFAGNAESS